MDWDDEDDLELAFEWDALHILHEYAWKAASARFPHVSMVLGLNLIDAIKTESIDQYTAQPYIDIFTDAADSGGEPKWD